MDLWDFPSLISEETLEESVAETEALRKADDAWITEAPVLCDLKDWTFSSAHRRYTVTADGVPFECLYFPGKRDKLYVMLSGGGAGTRRVPQFLRWKWKNYLDGHLLCIDDPMYHFHPGLPHVMWYYGTKTVSYLSLTLELEQKAMEELGISPENVIHVGSSGGGYAALYLCNMMDNSAAIVWNPQFILKPWQYPGVYQNFMKWGIDIGGEDPFNRNRICLTNQTSRFFICINYESKLDYEKQFQPFAQEHGIPLRYGISQYKNFITWLYAAKSSHPHTSFPEKIGFLAMDYWLEKAKRGADLNELRAVSLLFNEILHEKYVQLEDYKKANAQLKLYKAHSFSLLSQIVTKEWGSLLNRPEYPVFCTDTEIRLQAKAFSSRINYYTSVWEDKRYYQILYDKGIVYFRFLCVLLSLGDKREAWLERARGLAEALKHENQSLPGRVGKSAYTGQMECFILPVQLEEKNQRQTIRNLILRTMDLWRDE